MKRITYVILTSIIFGYISNGYAQQKKYLVEFTDKNNSPYSLSNPSAYLSSKSILRRTNQNISLTSRDLPVNQFYVDSVKNKGAVVWYKTKWLNGVVVLSDSITIQNIETLPFVKSTIKLSNTAINNIVKNDEFNNKNNTTSNQSLYGQSYNQNHMIGADTMHSLGIHGEGMTICVLDNGFRNVDILSGFSLLRNENRILGYYDFVHNENNVYDEGDHGTMVLSTIACYDSNTLIGTGYKASFYLFHTEDNNAEHWIEQVNWVVAAERADSLGADILTTSLGYSLFDDTTTHYLTSQMDGNTTIITRGADYAAYTGMVALNSAGNSGGSSWNIITAPADGDSVIAVGAVDSSGIKVGFSSFGPSADGRIKPDLCAMGKETTVLHPDGFYFQGSGTSFSCPVLCGMVAGFWQNNSYLTNMEVLQYLKQSASNFSTPNNSIGYGIPHFLVANSLVNGFKESKNKHNIILFPNPVDNYLSLRNIDNFPIKEILIYNTLGELVLKHELKDKKSDKTQLNVSNLKKGIYSVVVTTQHNTVEVLKLVK